MENPLKRYGLFTTPDNWKQVEDWIEAHDPESRIHLYTAAFMALNYAHVVVGRELEKENEKA